MILVQPNGLEVSIEHVVSCYHLEKDCWKFKMTNAKNGHGGKRSGAGRPKGSRMRRSEELAEKLIASGKCPLQALIRLAEKAEIDGDISQAINAWKSTLPYIYPRPKAVEFAPEELVELTRSLSEVRAFELTKGENSREFGERLERAIRKVSLAQ